MSPLRTYTVKTVIKLSQRIDGSAREPALVQETEYEVEKTDHLALYLGHIVKRCK